LFLLSHCSSKKKKKPHQPSHQRHLNPPNRNQNPNTGTVLYWLGERFAILFGFHDSSYDNYLERYYEYEAEREAAAAAQGGAGDGTDGGSGSGGADGTDPVPSVAVDTGPPAARDDGDAPRAETMELRAIGDGPPGSERPTDDPEFQEMDDAPPLQRSVD
jgi:hypothetical protein